MVGEPPQPGTRAEWGVVTEQLAGLGSTLREHYTEDGRFDALAELRGAIEDLTSAAARVGAAATAALRDPGVQQQAKDTFAALIIAMITTVDDVRRDLTDEDGASS